MGVKFQLSVLDNPIAEDHQKHFSHHAKANKNKLPYLLKSPANAARLLKSVEDYKNGLGQERSLIEE